MIEYKDITSDQLNEHLFDHFLRYQQVNQVWRKVDGTWVIKEEPFIDDWSKEDYAFLVQCLHNTLQTGGLVYGVFNNDELKGFASVEGKVFDEIHKYCDLSSLHVSSDMRGNGIGKQLFNYAKVWAKNHGAKKLYISGHSAVETQAFYRAMGCVEASVYNQDHVQMEPFDCQLECVL